MEKINEKTLFDLFSSLFIRKEGLSFPASYYAGREVGLVFDDVAETSYYVLAEDTVHISISTMQQAFAVAIENAIKKHGITMVTYLLLKRERSILTRSMEAHEFGHAIYTPNYFKMISTKKDAFIMNAFEDERMERLMQSKSKVMLVNFRKLVYLVNGVSPTDDLEAKMDSARNAFYTVVRFRQWKKELIAKVDELIVKWAGINRKLSPVYNYGTMRDFVNSVRNLYYEIAFEFYKDKMNARYMAALVELGFDKKLVFQLEEKIQVVNKIEQMNGGKEPSLPGEEGGDGGEGDGKEVSAKPDKPVKSVEKATTTDGDFTIDGIEEGPMIDSKEIEEAFDKLDGDTPAIEPAMGSGNDDFCEYYDDTTEDVLREIFSHFTSAHRGDGEASYGRNGRLEARRYGVHSRTDWNVFKHPQVNGAIQGFGKFHLNLFIDVSGSFHWNEKRTNEILFSLYRLEKENKYFSFDLITMQVGEKEHNEKDKLIKTGGGNCLDEEIFDIWNRHQKMGALNYNIVLFDGDAFSDASSNLKDGHTFAAFNAGNCTIITDDDNKRYHVQDWCKNAQVIFSDNYCEELFEHITDALREALR